MPMTEPVAPDSILKLALEHVNVLNSLLKMRSENIDIWSPWRGFGGSPGGLRGLAGSLELWEAFWEIIGGVLERRFSIFLEVNLSLG